VDLRRAIRGVGKTLISVGVLLFLFVGYQLWGTGLAEARGQRDLKAQFQQRLLTAPPTLPVPGGAPVTEIVAAPPDLGSAVALLEIPKIGVEKAVIEGVEVEDLKHGPGHYPHTPLPGEKGNSAIAGHRTTYGAPFYDLNELAEGDPIYVTTSHGRFRYDVKEKLVVHPIDGAWVLDPTEDDRLTLTTCEPRFSAEKRLIVVAGLVGTPVQVVQSSPAPEGGAPEATGTTEAPVATTPPRTAGLDAAGLSGGSAARGPAVLWGAVAGAIWLGAWLLARHGRKWLVYALATPVFLGALYVFYENVARLLPANF
jgi:sortase A